MYYLLSDTDEIMFAVFTDRSLLLDTVKAWRQGEGFDLLHIISRIRDDWTADNLAELEDYCIEIQQFGSLPPLQEALADLADGLVE